MPDKIFAASLSNIKCILCGQVSVTLTSEERVVDPALWLVPGLNTASHWSAVTRGWPPHWHCPALSDTWQLIAGLWCRAWHCHTSVTIIAWHQPLANVPMTTGDHRGPSRSDDSRANISLRGRTYRFLNTWWLCLHNLIIHREAMQSFIPQNI